MGDPIFQVLGSTIPPMVGRKRLMDRVISALVKKTPSHLNILGPRFSGKSVFLKALLTSNSLITTYASLVLWDLGHHTPQSDNEFMQQLCTKLGQALKSCGSDYGQILLGTEESHYGTIKEVIEALTASHSKVLIICDDFDKPLSTGKLTHNLWDNVLDLCQYTGFRLMTASRRPLKELIGDEHSATSKLWGVFESFSIGTFNEEDLLAILEKADSLVLTKGAVTELLNWTGAYPPLVASVLNQLSIEDIHGEISNETINDVASHSVDLPLVSNLIDSLWEDCPVLAKDLYLNLRDCGRLPISKIGIGKRSLLDKGFAVQQGEYLVASCKLLQGHLKNTGCNCGTLTCLFGDWNGYRTNVRGVLEHRLGQIRKFNEQLFKCVEIGITFLPGAPADALNNFTSIENQALDLIWRREFGQSKRLPQELIDYWKCGGREKNRTVEEMARKNWELPADRWAQMAVLQLLTGSTSQPFDSKAKVTSKDTYILLNAIHSFRNRHEHADGQEIPLGVAITALLMCIELLACLERESSE